VMAVRLVGVYYLPTWPNHFLSLVFRCIMRGGEISTSEESPHVGFFKSDPLPKPMLAIHARRIRQAMSHSGGTPYWETNELSLPVRLGNRLMHGIVYPWLHWRRRRAGLAAYNAPPQWQARSLVVLRNDAGQVLWVRDRQAEVWVLPGGVSAAEPPWATAARALGKTTNEGIALTGLSGVYPAARSAEMTFAFAAEGSGATGLVEGSETAYFEPGQEADDCRKEDQSVVMDVLNAGGEVVFRHLEADKA